MQTEILEREEVVKDRLEKYAPSYTEDVYDLTMYFDPLDYKCQKAYALMNYYKISYVNVGND